MLTILFALHFVVPILLCLAMALGTGDQQVFLVSAISMELFAVLSLLLYLIYSLRNFNLRLERHYAKVWAGDFWVFVCCGTWSLATAIILTVRTHNGGLCRDFSAVTKSCGFSHFVLALSWLAVPCAVTGAIARMLDWEGYDEARPPTPENPPVQTLQVPSDAHLAHKRSYRVPAAPPSPTRTVRYKISAGQVTGSTSSKTTMTTTRITEESSGSSGEGEPSQIKDAWTTIPV
ncbi:hypothetical protein VNI00_008311 [Paramarasmius palmivorus]|uniref:MARVEL domain-containing protein n=1 Tax=Paramarasmius palmivorus TaxID=297713 RepID=A0AAW0CXH1_9AGAR